MADIKELLIEDEGLRLTVYDDATGKPLGPGDSIVGNPTIGVGRNVSVDGRGITETEAMYLLGNDIAATISEAQHYFPWFNSLSDNRKKVIISLIFNMGITRYRGFKKMIAAMAVKDYEKAIEELLDSKAARMLPKRYNKLAEMLRE